MDSHSGSDHGAFLISAAESDGRTGTHVANLTPYERQMIEYSLAKVGDARILGQNRDAGTFYDEVRRGGALDVKNDEKRWGRVDQRARERFGNWLFGAAGASWEQGALGNFGAKMSDLSGQGETALRKGAGIYQMFGSGGSGVKWEAGQLIAPLALPGNTYGDNADDPRLISQGYDFYYDALYPQAARSRR